MGAFADALVNFRERYGHVPGALVNRVLRPLGVRLVSTRDDLFVYQHDYGAGGFEEYRRLQIAHNRRKFGKVFADDETLQVISQHIKKHGLDRVGICHGARNGWEVQRFRELLGCEVIGTDISDTAAAVPHLVQHDFHERRIEWIGKFSFVYTNSLDQAFDPRKALKTWAEQLAPDGLMYIEHTMLHSSAGASKMDPFGAHPMVVPYLLFVWGRGKYKLIDILHVERVQHLSKGKVWIFVIKRSKPNG